MSLENLRINLNNYLYSQGSEKKNIFDDTNKLKEFLNSQNDSYSFSIQKSDLDNLQVDGTGKIFFKNQANNENLSFMSGILNEFFANDTNRLYADVLRDGAITPFEIKNILKGSNIAFDGNSDNISLEDLIKLSEMFNYKIEDNSTNTEENNTTQKQPDNTNLDEALKRLRELMAKKETQDSVSAAEKQSDDRLLGTLYNLYDYKTEFSQFPPEDLAEDSNTNNSTNDEDINITLDSAAEQTEKDLTALKDVLAGNTEELKAQKSDLEELYQEYYEELAKLDEEDAEKLKNLFSEYAKAQNTLSESEINIAEKTEAERKAKSNYTQALYKITALEKTLEELKNNNTNSQYDEEIKTLEDELNELKKYEAEQLELYNSHKESLKEEKNTKISYESEFENIKDAKESFEIELSQKYPQMVEYMLKFNEAYEEYEINKTDAVFNAQKALKQSQDNLSDLELKNNYNEVNSEIQSYKGTSEEVSLEELEKNKKLYNYYQDKLEEAENAYREAFAKKSLLEDILKSMQEINSDLDENHQNALNELIQSQIRNADKLINDANLRSENLKSVLNKLEQLIKETEEKTTAKETENKDKNTANSEIIEEVMSEIEELQNNELADNYDELKNAVTQTQRDYINNKISALENAYSNILDVVNSQINSSDNNTIEELMKAMTEIKNRRNLLLGEKYEELDSCTTDSEKDFINEQIPVIESAFDFAIKNVETHININSVKEYTLNLEDKDITTLQGMLSELESQQSKVLHDKYSDLANCTTTYKRNYINRQISDLESEYSAALNKINREIYKKSAIQNAFGFDGDNTKSDSTQLQQNFIIDIPLFYTFKIPQNGQPNTTITGKGTYSTGMSDNYTAKYDDQGRLVSIETDKDNKSIKYIYDKNGEFTQTEYALGTLCKTQYNNDGSIKTYTEYYNGSKLLERIYSYSFEGIPVQIMQQGEMTFKTIINADGTYSKIKV